MTHSIDAAMPQTVEAAIRARVEGLKEDAATEAEPFNAASEDDLWRFLKSVATTRRPLIARRDNGNLRALWENESGEQIGLQFLGGGAIQFVIFARRPDSRAMSRSAGRDSFLGIREQIAAFGLDELMRA